MFNRAIQKYIQTKRLCVIAVEMPDGSPHAATVHFAHTVEPFVFVVQTSFSSRKAEPIIASNESRVSLVIGLEEMRDGKDTTLQIDGIAKLVPSDGTLAHIYFEKFPEKKGRWPDDIFISIIPTWWRYTDWSKSGRDPQIVTNS